MKTLENITPGAMTEISNTLHQIAERIKRRGLIILISDLLDDSERLINGLKHFRHRGHEIVIFHLLDPKEISLEYGGEVRFVDSETGEKIRTQPWFLKKEYSADIGRWIHGLETACKENAIDYNLVTTDTSFDKALFSYLNKRRRMR